MPPDIQSLKCKEKTSRGNVYGNAAEAEERARRLRNATGDPIHAYLCPVCAKFHIGKREVSQRIPLYWASRRMRGGRKERERKIFINNSIRMPVDFDEDE